MITSFPTKQIANMAGLQSFLFSPTQLISSYPPATKSKVTTPLTFWAGATLLAGYSTLGQLQFTETATKTDNGTVYDWLVTGYYPGDTPEIIDLFAEMELSRHVVVTKDFAGINRLIGINCPLEFLAVYDSGKAPGNDAKGYTFTFTGQSIRRAPVYSV